MNDNTPDPTTGVIRLNGPHAFAEQSTELIDTALRSIDLLCHTLEPAWLGNADFVECLKSAIVSNHRLQVRLLIANPWPAIHSHHPLIPLIKRLSRFQAKVIDEDILEKQPISNDFILIDQTGIVIRQSVTDFIGFAHFDDRQSVMAQKELFERYWRFSHAIPDLRYMHL